MKKISILFLTVLFVLSLLAGCSQADIESGNETSSPIETEEATTTTMRTTEDLGTTFKEVETNKVYPALSKDTNGNYPYKISTYTTHYTSSNVTRTTNIHSAVEHLDNIKIPSGKIFSFNQTVGKRTVLAGYEEAKVVNGKEFIDGLGGGICQVSSTIFQAVLRANLQIRVRACHSLEISYVPLGGDATVQWNSQDFQFVNDSPCDIRLSVVANNGTLTCSVYAKEDITPEDLKVEITKSGNSYTLTRTVKGEENYKTYSKYSKPKTTTEKTTDKKDKDKDKTTDKTTKKTATKKEETT